uniref:Uncharacterized protein n=1 Tax=Sphaerodactylus townsendi TaxID=933632 RepID=A0ACB8ELX8_9SAUR
MGARRLLALILLLQIISSRPAAGRKMPETGIRDALQTPLATQPLQEAPLPREVLHGHYASHLPARNRPKRHVRDRPEEPGCHLRSVLVRVKDLGLGYDSGETILFKYCSGSCPKARSNHDLTLSLLLQTSGIPALGEPCCRPSHYENVAFLDNSHQWHEVEQLSASSCSCMG